MSRAVEYKAYIKELDKVLCVTNIFNLTDEDFTRVVVDLPNEEDWGSYIIDGKDNHLMRHTGLKDRNGVEIYEGDIISCVGGIKNKKHKE